MVVFSAGETQNHLHRGSCVAHLGWCRAGWHITACGLLGSMCLPPIYNIHDRAVTGVQRLPPGNTAARNKAASRAIPRPDPLNRVFNAAISVCGALRSAVLHTHMWQP